MVLNQMQDQYNRRTSQAVHCDEVQNRLSFYKETTQELQAWIDQHGHRPIWNTLDAAEKLLLSKIEWAQTHTDQADPTPETLQAYLTLEELWDANPPPTWTYEEFLARYEDYGRRTGNWFPIPLVQKPDASVEETEMYNNMLYHMQARPETQSALRDIRKKYNVK